MKCIYCHGDIPDRNKDLGQFCCIACHESFIKRLEIDNPSCRWYIPKKKRIYPICNPGWVDALAHQSLYLWSMELRQRSWARISEHARACLLFPNTYDAYTPACNSDPSLCPSGVKEGIQLRDCIPECLDNTSSFSFLSPKLDSFPLISPIHLGTTE